MMMKRSIKIKQYDTTDCGAACLASVCAYYGLKVPVARIRQYAYTDQKGTNILGMVEAAQKLGFSAKGVRGVYDVIGMIPVPAIAHIVVKRVLHHFIVLYKISKKGVTYMDPADGKIHKATREEFEKIWTGILVLLEPNETFEKGNKKTSLTIKFLKLLSPHKSMMLQALFGALVYSILGLSVSIYVESVN